MEFAAVKLGYANLWARAQVRAEWSARIGKVVDRIVANRKRYETIQALTTVPWWWVACIHDRESGGNFQRHLHNGDPLTARTVREPAGRPAKGEPPFTFEQSAVDAIDLKGLDKFLPADWTTERALWEFERYNGLGYFGKGNSPYLWSGTNLYTAGKYVADHVYDASAVDQQIGVAALLKALVGRNLVTFGEAKGDHTVQDIKAFIGPIGGLIPNVVAVLGGPMAQFAIKAIAEAIPGDVAANPTEVTNKLQEQPFTKVLQILQSVNEMLAPLANQAPVGQSPAPTPVVVVNQPPAVIPNAAPSPIDNMFGGVLKGWKTVIGIVGFAAIYMLSNLHIMPGILTPDIQTVLMTLFGGLAGIGYAAKQDRAANGPAGG